MSVSFTIQYQSSGFADKLSVKLIASFLLSYPLAGVLKRIPDAKPYQKNLFIISYALMFKLIVPWH